MEGMSSRSCRSAAAGLASGFRTRLKLASAISIKASKFSQAEIWRICRRPACLSRSNSSVPPSSGAK